MKLLAPVIQQILLLRLLWCPFTPNATATYELIADGAGVPKPSAVTLDAILNDQELLAGFDDPEVLAAVNDIANNPDRGQQYATNKKVWKQTSTSASHNHSYCTAERFCFDPPGSKS